MGVYSEYLDKRLSFDAITKERKQQLARISRLRGGRDVMVFAADLSKGQGPVQAPISIQYSDLLPFNDQLSNLTGSAIDLILETPGGSGEVAEDIVHLLRKKYADVAVIVPGYAKSAGTIVAMAADEILMDSASALGPIDAQLTWQGKVFSADALLEGVKKIKDEVTDSGVLNKAYIPILQGISPGELQSAENTLEFARKLVTQWLATHKFKNWELHSSTGAPVTEEERLERAKSVATQLCDHKSWLTHGRSIRIEDLRQMRVQITDLADTPELADAIRRYYTLLQMTFASNAYKVFETANSQILRFVVPQVPGPGNPPAGAVIPQNATGKAKFNLKCNNCQNDMVIQANIGARHPLEAGSIAFPSNNKVKCTQCGVEHDLTEARRQLEAQTKKAIVT